MAMNIQESLAQEWTTLQTSHERYETGGLLIKLFSVALTVAGFALHLNLKLMLALVALVWLQEAIYRTFQSRLGRRILRVEQLFEEGVQGIVQRGGQGGAPGDAKSDAKGDMLDAAFQLHSEWLASRPGALGLMAEYARSACRPTVAFPYAVLMSGLAYLLWR